MGRWILWAACIACAGAASCVCAAAAANAPAGVVSRSTFASSRIFPGTVRDYWVYVPAQYDGKTPACVHVNQDGVQFGLPGVMDRLIASGGMPVTVGVFVAPGRVRALSTNALDRFNRSFEYDGMGDGYARFLLDELLPHVARAHGLNLSTNGNDRSIGGSSSGAVCAFTAAWERPDAFSRVLSAVGTYVGLRGGNDYPTLVRKTEPKALRVFLQDGSGDLNIYCGDWWMANQEMERALAFAGYEVGHAWDDGGHSGKGMTAVCEEAMRWLWKGWPAKPQKGLGSQQMKDLLIPGEEWAVADGLAVDAAVARADGSAYAAGTGLGSPITNALWLVRGDGSRVCVDAGFPGLSGLALSPDQSLLYACDSRSHWVYSYQVQADGTLAHKQRYYYLHQRHNDDDSGACGLCCDRDGRLYVATRMGVQVCDQAGRVNVILPAPGGCCMSVGFGGPELDELVITCGGAAYARKLKARGLRPAQAAVRPPAPRL